MWAIQLFDGKPGVVYLREALLDGRILVFDQEEAALRFMIAVKEKMEAALNIRLRTVRYDADPRKDRPYKASAKALPELARLLTGGVSMAAPQ